MSGVTTSILAASLSVLLLLSIYRVYRDRRYISFSLRIVGLLLAALFLHFTFNFPSTSQSKGPSTWDDLYPVIGLYLAMVLGMLAHYAYAHLSLPAAQRGGFDWANFIAPIFLSPIVFIPIYETLKAVPQTSATVMALLVAFENGFFFKNFMEVRQQLHDKPIEAKQHVNVTSGNA